MGIPKREITEEQYKSMQIKAVKIIDDQVKKGELSKTPPPGTTTGAVYGEVAYYQAKLLPIEKHAKEIASKVLQDQGMEVKPALVGVGFRASPKEKELVNYIESQIKEKMPTKLAMR